MNRLASICVLLAVCSFVLTNCKKDISSVTNNASPLTENDFFFSYPAVAAEASIARELMFRENRLYGFANKYLQSIGKPRWDKPVTFRRQGQEVSGRSESVDDSLLIYVPFVRDSQQYVNAVLMVGITGADTTINMLFDWQYPSIGHPGYNQAAPANAFHIFSLLNREVFGLTKYNVADYSLLPASILESLTSKGHDLDSLDIMIGMRDMETQSSRIDYVDVCNNHEYCVRIKKKKAFREDQPVTANVEPYECEEWGTYTVCTKVWYFTSDDQGWSPGPDQGGGGSYPNPSQPPCPNPGPPYSALDDGTPCHDGPGWVLVDPVDLLWAGIEDPVNYQDQELIQNGISAVILTTPPPQQPSRTIGKTINRGNSEDMESGTAGDVSGIDPVMPLLSDGALFARMRDLFSWCTFFDADLADVGEDMIDHFQASTAAPYSHYQLNKKVGESVAFLNFMKTFGNALQEKLRAVNGAIDFVPEMTLGYHPVFNGLYNKFHGLQILINDTEFTEIKLDRYYKNPNNNNWEADVTVTITDHFGLDKHDALLYQGYHDGFAAWWLLQHTRGYLPFHTVITRRVRISGQL